MQTTLLLFPSVFKAIGEDRRTGYLPRRLRLNFSDVFDSSSNPPTRWSSSLEDEYRLTLSGSVYQIAGVLISVGTQTSPKHPEEDVWVFSGGRQGIRHTSFV